MVLKHFTMRCCNQDPEKKVTNTINKRIREDQRAIDREIKLLLLGAGESGKSTIAKQMKIIHMQGFDAAELQNYKAVVNNNIVESMKTLLKECKAKAEIRDQEAAARIEKLPYTNRVLSRETASDIRALWADTIIQQTFANQTGFYVMDNIAHYFHDIDRIAAEGYVPTEEDILKSRVQTTGIYETEFDIQDAHFKMIDVGGQRNERKKWIHCFDNVTAVLFCVAMSEYDQKLIEDDETPRMHESLNLFAEVCQMHWFMDTAMILFLNKDDIFREKIGRTPLTVCFPEYPGANEYTQAKEYIQGKFTSMDESGTKAIYPHFTTATNTHNIVVVFKAVRDCVLRAQLKRNGMMS